MIRILVKIKQATINTLNKHKHKGRGKGKGRGREKTPKNARTATKNNYL